MKTVPLLLLLPLLAACRSSRPGEAAARTMDPHSRSRPDLVRVRHVELDLELDFERREARGSATLTLERGDRSAPLVCDVQGLEVRAVSGADGRPRRHSLEDCDDKLGCALEVELAPDDDRVRIEYRTTAASKALQWLSPEQTTDGHDPFLFTQGQAVLTRTWIPLQDSPGVRVTYEARIRAPEGLTAVMSAEQLGRDGDGAFRFRMPEPIPPYLIALACGRIAFEPISERAGVWAEPSVAKPAAKELEDVEAMIASAEQLFGAYRWGRYDVIVLPAAFPYGGMENPRLTFATPTILAGDKSLVALIAHELAHSWSGNLVTNATWRDFWLNEGSTVYFENRIMERVFGTERARMEAQLARDGLEREMAELEPRDQVLHVDLEGRHPDDGFSGVPYEKGALFLRRLEEVFGREEFDRFLGAWFDEHAFESVTTETFVAFLDERLLARDREKAASIDVRAWLEEPGLPADAPRASSDALAAVDREVGRWRAGTAPAALDTRGWATQQWLHLLESTADDLDAAKMSDLDRAFSFTKTGNSEILCTWLRLSIRHRYATADARLELFLRDVGRRKFLVPLYKELLKTPEGAARARTLYAANRPRYHAVATGTLDDLFAKTGA